MEFLEKGNHIIVANLQTIVNGALPYILKTIVQTIEKGEVQTHSVAAECLNV